MRNAGQIIEIERIVEVILYMHQDGENTLAVITLRIGIG